MENLAINADQIGGILVGGILAFGFMGEIIGLIMEILTIIGGWKLFKKFGEPGWKALVPFYNTWTEYHYTWKPTMAIPMYVCGFGGGLVMELTADGSVPQIIASILFLVGVVFNIVAYSKRSKAFGHGIGYTIGHIVAPGIMTMVLGFGKDVYVGNSTTTDVTADNNQH